MVCQKHYIFYTSRNTENDMVLGGENYEQLSRNKMFFVQRTFHSQNKFCSWYDKPYVSKRLISRGDLLWVILWKRMVKASLY